MVKRRQPSKLIRIGDLLNAQEIVNKNPFEDEERRYIVLNDENLVRVKIFGTVVSRREGETSNEGGVGKKYLLIEVDDGTGTITVAFFGMTSIFEKIHKGDIVDIVGRPRSYNGVISVTAQSVQVADIEFELYQRVNLLEIESSESGFEAEGKIPKYLTLRDYTEWRKSRETSVEDEVISVVPQTENKETISAHVLEVIKSTEGISIESIYNILNYSKEEIDAAIQNLRTEGEIMTPSSGKFKAI